MSNYAPVILFVYNRPYQTIQTLKYLSLNSIAKKTKIIIFADAAKPNCKLDQKKVKLVKYIIKNFKGFKNKKIYFRNKNFGLFKNIIDGINKVFLTNKKAIILEDDIIVNKFFLSNINKALKIYQNDTSISCINGWFPEHNKKIPETFFLRGADIWGWATWKRAWKDFNIKDKTIFKKFEEQDFLKKDFNLNNSYEYYDLLIKTLNNKKKSWGILWMAQNYLKNKFYLNFSNSLCINIGQDNSGENTFNIGPYFNQNLLNKKIKFDNIKISENFEAKKIKEIFFKNYYKKNKIFIFFIKMKNYVLNKLNYYKQRLIFVGPYKSWEKIENLNKVSYEDPKIFKKILKNTILSKNNLYYGERDGKLLFQNFIQHELLNTLVYLILKKRRSLNIVDFGGSLASQYFKIKDIINLEYIHKWNVIEQKKLAKIGNKKFKSKFLKFSDNLKKFKNQKIDLIILSGSIQYIKDPLNILNDVFNLKSEFIFFDRTPFISTQTNNIFIQKKGDASYPSWIFSYSKFKKMIINSNYKIIDEINSEFDNDIFLKNKKVKYLGFLLKKNALKNN